MPVRSFLRVVASSCPNVLLTVVAIQRKLFKDVCFVTRVEFLPPNLKALAGHAMRWYAIRKDSKERRLEIVAKRPRLPNDSEVCRLKPRCLCLSALARKCGVRSGIGECST
jgi:hypothetical protein